MNNNTIYGPMAWGPSSGTSQDLTEASRRQVILSTRKDAQASTSDKPHGGALNLRRSRPWTLLWYHIGVSLHISHNTFEQLTRVNYHSRASDLAVDYLRTLLDSHSTAWWYLLRMTTATSKVSRHLTKYRRGIKRVSYLTEDWNRTTSWILTSPSIATDLHAYSKTLIVYRYRDISRPQLFPCSDLPLLNLRLLISFRNSRTVTFQFSNLQDRRGPSMRC